MMKNNTKSRWSEGGIFALILTQIMLIPSQAFASTSEGVIPTSAVSALNGEPNLITVSQPVTAVGSGGPGVTISGTAFDVTFSQKVNATANSVGCDWTGLANGFSTLSTSSGTVSADVIYCRIQGDLTSTTELASITGLRLGYNGGFSAQFNFGILNTSYVAPPQTPPPGQQVVEAAAAPAKYSGPEFSSLSLKPVMHGSSTTLTGKRLSQVSSIEIGGKAATFTAVSDTELSLTPAADLAPGTYDLVIHSSAGKLTHINAVRVQPALRPISITTRSENRITETQYYEHSLIAAMQQPELTKARCIVNGPNLALAKAQAQRLCSLVKAANPNIETTVIEPRSTVKNSTVFARVTYGWN